MWISLEPLHPPPKPLSRLPPNTTRSLHKLLRGGNSPNAYIMPTLDAVPLRTKHAHLTSGRSKRASKSSKKRRSAHQSMLADFVRMPLDIILEVSSTLAQGRHNQSVRHTGVELSHEAHRRIGAGVPASPRPPKLCAHQQGIQGVTHESPFRGDVAPCKETGSR